MIVKKKAPKFSTICSSTTTFMNPDICAALLYMHATIFLCFLLFQDSFSDLDKSTLIAVIANMPGYKSRNTCIWLEEAAMTLDFVLDPEVILKGNLPRSGYTSRLEFVDFLWGSHLRVFVSLIVVVGFLYLLLLRRRNTNLSKHRHLGGQKIAGGV